jgi:hypothetical protein
MASAHSYNMRLLAHHELQGFGGMGEGMGLQLAKGGRRILWLAHESAPKNFTGVDVTDPRAPRVVVQTELPHAKMRSNSLDVVGDTLAVAYQTSSPGMKPAGFELFDVSTPEEPSSSRTSIARAPIRAACTCSGSSTAKPFTCLPAHRIFSRATRRTTSSTGSSTCAIRRSPQRSAAGGCRERAKATTRRLRSASSEVRQGLSRPQHERFSRAAGPRVCRIYRRRRADLDISDKARPKLVSHWRYSPPFNGFTHTVLPLLGRNLLIVADEAVMDAGADWPKLVWVVDARVEANLVPIATLPAPPYQEFVRRGGRFGAHNLHENLPVPGSWRSEQIVIGTFFNAGVRAYDVLNPYQPQEVASFVPETPNGARTGAVQLNDVYVDERRVVYTVDRHIGGLYVLEMTI